MTTIREAIALGRQALAAVPDPKVDALALLGEATGLSPLNLRLRAMESLKPEQEERYRSLLLLRAQREPLQYLLGTQCFFGFDFAVDRRVLIPRQETEMLCELALLAMKGHPAPSVLDLCTGSGAIAVTLKRMRPDAEVTAADVSVDALSVAAANAARNGAAVRFVRGDLLTPVQDEQFDLIVCNPPYIDSAACETLQPEVLREPRLALDGGADGLDFYRQLAAGAPAFLKPHGHLMVEVGDAQAERVAALFTEKGLLTDAAIHRDLYGMERFVTARLAEAFPT